VSGRTSDFQWVAIWAKLNAGVTVTGFLGSDASGILVKSDEFSQGPVQFRRDDRLG
jgi:hypothetical protein